MNNVKQTSITPTAIIKSVNLNMATAQVNQSSVNFIQKITPQNTQNKISMTTEKFMSSLSSGNLLVKDIKIGKTQTLQNVRVVQVGPEVLDNINVSSVVKPAGITPKQNYTRADSSYVNIHAHKGPDESKNNGITT